LVIILVVLVGLFVVIVAVSPSELQIEKTETINAPATSVCLDKWQAWSAWQKMDPEMKNEYSENPCGAELGILGRDLKVEKARRQ
jgi:hypothetical protein